MANRISPQLIFGDDTLKIVDFSAIFANPEWLATALLYFIVAGLFWLSARAVYVAVKEHRLDQRIFSGAAAIAAAMLLIAPLLPVQWALELPQRIGMTPLESTSTTPSRQTTTQPVGLAQWMMITGYTFSDSFANHAALKLVSLNPLTAPQMPLLKKQADQYFENGENVGEVAKENVRITGGAFSERDFNRHVIDGAGVAYASAGLNQAGYARQDIPAMPDSRVMATLGGDSQRIKRLVWMWNKNEPAAMAECVGNTLLSDYAFALSIAKNSTSASPFAGYTGLPTGALTAWEEYYGKAHAYLYAGGNSGGSSTFGSRWTQQGQTGDAGSEVNLPSPTEILNGHTQREHILSSESFRAAWAPGTDASELLLNRGSVEARLIRETDPLAKQNDMRLLEAIKAREVAETTASLLKDSVTTAFEKIASAHAMANLSNQQVGGFMTVLSNGIEIPGGADAVKLINSDQALGKCRAFGNRVKALNVGFSTDDLKPSGLKEKLSELMGGLPDKGISAARQVAANGWMMLGVYYISTADTYQNFFDGQNEINEAAQASSVNYMASDPVARQADSIDSIGSTAYGTAGTSMAIRYGSDLKGAAKFMETAGGKFVGTVAKKGAFLGLLGVWKDFAPYVAFVFVVLWWLLKMVAIFTSMPYIILFAAGGHIFSESGHQWQWIMNLLKRMMVLVFMPVVYVIGWGVIFFGAAIIDVLVISTSGEASVGGAATSIISGNFGQAAFLDSGIVQLVVKFVLGLAISMVLFKIEGWVVQYISFGDKSDADMNTGPKPNNISPA